MKLGLFFCLFVLYSRSFQSIFLRQERFEHEGTQKKNKCVSYVPKHTQKLLELTTMPNPFKARNTDILPFSQCIYPQFSAVNATKFKDQHMTPEPIIAETTGLPLQHTHTHVHTLYESLLKPGIWHITVLNSPEDLTELLADQTAPPSVTVAERLALKKCLVIDTVALLRMQWRHTAYRLHVLCMFSITHFTA